MSESRHSVELLKAKYSFGSLYLTYIPLNDLTILLNEDEKFAKLAAQVSPPESLLVFKAFLDNKREHYMNEAVAFVQLELSNGKAGFKKMSDQDGIIYPIPWSPSQVWAIAGFCDRFLNRLPVIEEAQTSVAERKLSVDQALKTREKLKADPYIPATRIAELTSTLAVFFADIFFEVMTGMVKADSVEPKFAKIREAAKKLTKQDMHRIAAVAGKYYAERANPSPKKLSREHVENLKMDALEFALKTNGK